MNHKYQLLQCFYCFCIGATKMCAPILEIMTVSMVADTQLGVCNVNVEI